MTTHFHARRNKQTLHMLRRALPRLARAVVTELGRPHIGSRTHVQAHYASLISGMQSRVGRGRGGAQASKRAMSSAMMATRGARARGGACGRVTLVLTFLFRG